MIGVAAQLRQDIPTGSATTRRRRRVRAKQSARLREERVAGFLTSLQREYDHFCRAARKVHYDQEVPWAAAVGFKYTHALIPLAPPRPPLPRCVCEDTPTSSGRSTPEGVYEWWQGTGLLGYQQVHATAHTA